MSAQLEAAIAAVDTLAQAEGVTVERLVFAIIERFNLAVPSIWNADGTTNPDEQGLIRILALETFHTQLVAAGQTQAAQMVCARWACVPGMLRIADPLLQLEIQTDLSWASMTEMGMGAFGVGGRAFVFQRSMTPLGPHTIQIPGQYVPDAGALGNRFDTVDKCVVEVKRRVQQFLVSERNPHPTGVDFSPLPSNNNTTGG